MSAPFQPMLAKPMNAAIKKGVVTDWKLWGVQVKYDGWRLIIEKHTARNCVEVTAWTRPRGDDDAMAECELLTDEIIAQLALLPDGVYDGELLVDVKDAVGTDVPRKEWAHLRYVVLFDVLRCACGPLKTQRSMVNDSCRERHQFLLDVAGVVFEDSNTKVKVAPMTLLTCEKDVTDFVAGVWKQGGEGAILKRLDAVYSPGKRTFDFIKVKRVSHAVLTLVGFEKSKGTVRFPGHPFAVLKLRDEDGNETTVKAKDDAMLKSLETEFRAKHGARLGAGVWPSDAGTAHPAIGRRVMIEFPKRTRTGGYQGPVLFDRWAEEGE